MPAPREVVVVDPGDANPVFQHLSDLNLKLSAILITHHHWDHTNGIDDLLARWPVPVYGPERVSQVDHSLNGGDQLTSAGYRVANHCPCPAILSTISVTSVSPEQQPPLLLCGDTLFSAGCGRLFEGTPEQMHHSLQVLAALPADTQVLCTHEYTLSNLAFARAVETR